MSALLARPENRITPSASARGAAPSIAPLHEVPRIIFMPSTSGQLLEGGDGVLGVALGVFDDELQLASVDASGGVDLVGGHLLGADGDVAVGLAGAGDGFHDADAEGGIGLGFGLAEVAGGEDEGGKQDCGGQDDQDSGHRATLGFV